MLRRYMTIITDQGMDAAIPLVDDPDALREFKAERDEQLKLEIAQLYSKYGKQIFDSVFENNQPLYVSEDGKIPVLSSGYRESGLNSEIEQLKEKAQEDFIEFGQSPGGVNPMEYQMFNLRARFAGDVKLQPIFATDEKNFEALRSMSGWHAAFYVLDGLIRDETELGRFGETSKRKILLKNMMEDDDRNNDKKKIKSLRRIFFDKINGSGEEDPDEI